MAGILPEGTLGIRRFSITLNVGQTYTLDGCSRGLYLYQNISASHIVGAALIYADGNATEIVQIPYIRATQSSGVVYFEKAGLNEPVTIHNGYSTVQGVLVTYIRV